MREGLVPTVRAVVPPLDIRPVCRFLADTNVSFGHSGQLRSGATPPEPSRNAVASFVSYPRDHTG